MTKSRISLWRQEVTCHACGEPVVAGAKFCGECGAPVRAGGGNAASTGGGDIHGGLYQAGRDVVVNPPPVEPAAASYGAVPRWRSPFTLGLLSWAGLVLGLFSLFPLWKVFEPLLDLLGSGSGDVTGGNAQMAWLAGFVATVLLLVLVCGLRRITKYQLRKPLIFGWAISGAGRRITLGKIRAGRCPRCGGKMRYLNKATEWIDHREANGRKWREVTERVPALECRRNPKHWAEVDPADGEES